MYTDITWQDWLAASDSERMDMLLTVIRGYRASKDFKDGLLAQQYFRAENPVTASKTLLKPVTVRYKDDKNRDRKTSRTEEIAGNRVFSSFFFRFVVQQNQFLLANGVTLENDAQKQKLGPDFDQVLEQIGEKALVHGCAWGFWNLDHLEIIEAVKDKLSGAVALLDERTSEPMMLIQFWQINANRPLYIRLYSMDGLVEYICKDDKLEEVEASRRAYVVRTETDAFGVAREVGENYGNTLPVIPLWASSEKRSELTPSIKSKIDLFERVLSDFGDNLDRANDVYWVLNNFGGTVDDIAEMLEQINRVKAVANYSDGTGTHSTAEPHTMEVPYAARKEALDILESQLYADYMAMDMDELTGGSLTNVAIRAATTNLNLKADRYEWQVRAFVEKLLVLLGIKSNTIKFKRQNIANESEIVSDIAVMRADIDHETALKLNPYVEQEEIDTIIANQTAEASTDMPSVDKLDKVLQGGE